MYYQVDSSADKDEIHIGGKEECSPWTAHKSDIMLGIGYHLVTSFEKTLDASKQQELNKTKGEMDPGWTGNRTEAGMITKARVDY